MLRSINGNHCVTIRYKKYLIRLPIAFVHLLSIWYSEKSALKRETLGGKTIYFTCSLLFMISCGLCVSYTDKCSSIECCWFASELEQKKVLCLQTLVRYTKAESVLWLLPLMNPQRSNQWFFCETVEQSKYNVNPTVDLEWFGKITVTDCNQKKGGIQKVVCNNPK